jgi:aspartyl-tRNA(Asn)/glutamyl-tRNA(Gln) amidotransferase subunit A
MQKGYFLKYGGFNLMKRLSILELTKKYASKELSPVEYAKETIKMLEKDNLNAILAFDENALISDAQKSEQRYRDGSPLSLVDGVPIGIKDVIDTKGLITTYGCEAYRQHIPQEDAYVVKTLKKAGALTSIKTNTSQFAMGPTGETSLHGGVRTPHASSCFTGGSSSGSAAAVAAGMLVAALGTDTGGSVRIPAAICGVVGMKPTYSLLSIAGIMPLNESLDTVGVLSNSNIDNAAVLQVLVSFNNKDWRQSFPPNKNYLKGIGENIDSMNIGVLSDLFEGCIDPQISDCCMKAVARLRSENKVNVREKSLPDISAFRNAHKFCLSTFGRSVHLADIEKHPECIHPQVRSRLDLGTISGVEYVNFERKKNELISIMIDAMSDVECLVYPTTAITAQKIGDGEKSVKLNGIETSGFASTGALTWIGNFTGLPCVSIPVGKNKEGLPIGLMLMARPYEENTLYRIAEKIMQSV